MKVVDAHDCVPTLNHVLYHVSGAHQYLTGCVLIYGSRLPTVAVMEPNHTTKPQQELLQSVSV